ncbi:protein of unknown function DUF1611 [Halothece sp. PCC 7418]|uniref:DUF1611 domain-containing protein n=1 Tax=Halothece sp. (strain PCC 7418) TaxID=65093 RepID=UPI0002A076F7|nr:DUF1611 domain-containing protein [Halothece sp. PCC 7418]AFZ44885.1 protein of unknown function DUF1611 [Halothece sp. PCC 7418]
MQLTPDHRVAILLHEGIRGEHGKTGLTFLRYSEAAIAAIIDQQCVGESLADLRGIQRDVPIVENVSAALTYHPDVLLIGIAPSGGQLPLAWQEEIKQAVKAGVSLVNGLHTPIRSLFTEELTLQSGQWIWDVREEPTGLGIGSGKARFLSCQRILTVGTDMSIGKMSTSLELVKLAQQQGYRTKFLATGQGGMMLSGGGIPLDAIRVDFAAGAVEKLVLDAGDTDYDWLFVEGQGSLLHPGSTAVLPLLRGSQPTDLILVHRARQTAIKNFPDIKIPPLTEIIKLYEMLASGAGAFGKVKVRGIALNTFELDDESAKQEIAKVSEETGLPCNDVIRFSGENLFSALVSY